MLVNTTKMKTLILLISVLSLAGCAQTPSSIPLNPQLSLTLPKENYHNLQPWQIQSQDLRVAKHLIEIVDGDKVAKLINEQDSLRLLIENNLRKSWTEKQLKTASKSDFKVNIQLVKALSTVTESTLSYDVNSDMMIKVQLQHQGKTFVKLFQSTETWNAAFSTSVSRINTKIENQLSQLLSDIVQDNELNGKLNQF